MLNRRFYTLIVFFFFLSGLSGLIYEILWVRMLTRWVGGSNFAVSIVLTVFMGGLALGSYIASRFTDRIKQPANLALLYGLLELFIGLYGLAFAFLLPLCKPVFSLLYNDLFLHGMLYNLVAGVLGGLLLLIPTTLMGASLPILCRFYTDSMARLGTRTGLLYGLNTFGAAAGTFLCGFFLIQFLGLYGTLAVAIVINVFIGVACVVMFRPSVGPPLAGAPSLAPGIAPAQALQNTDATVGPPLAGAPSLAPGIAQARALLFIFAVSGFSAMGCEVIWTKLLGLLVGPTTYSFSLVVFTFICGLALGGIICGKLADRVRSPLSLLYGTQVAAALFILLVSHVLGNSQLFFAKLLFDFQDHYALMETLKGLSIFLCLLPPTLCFGAAFPLVSKLYTPDLDHTGKAIGQAYALNTIGALLGAFIAGFVLIPMLGKEKGLALLAALQAGAVLGVALYAGGSRSPQRELDASSVGRVCDPVDKNSTPVGPPLAGAPSSVPGIAQARALQYTLVFAFVVLLLCFFLPRWNHDLLSVGKYHRFSNLGVKLDLIGYGDALFHGPRLLTAETAGEKLLYYGDGIGGFTTVKESTDALGNTVLFMVNSGKVDASSALDNPTQVLEAHIPLLLHPNPKKVMVLGLASGITAGEMLDYPIDQLDIVEISPQVVEASRFFTNWNNDVVGKASVGRVCDPADKELTPERSSGLQPPNDSPRPPRTSDATVRLIVQDGRTHLDLTDEKYDVISSEPSNPWMAGLANLFTVDFYQAAYDHLNTDGIFVQVVHIYQMDRQSFSLIGRSLSRVFPKVWLFETAPKKVYLFICCKDRGAYDPAVLDRHIADARKSTNMKLSRGVLLDPLIVSSGIENMFPEGPVHSEAHPYLEFTAPRSFYQDDPAIAEMISAGRIISAEVAKGMESFDKVDRQLDFAEFIVSVNSSPFGIVNLLKATPAQAARYRELCAAYCRLNASIKYTDYPEWEKNVAAETHRDLAKKRIEEMTQARGEGTPAPITASGRDAVLLSKAYSVLGLAQLSLGDARSACESFQAALAGKPSDPDILSNLAICRESLGDHLEALAIFNDLLKTEPRSANYLYHAAINALALGRAQESADALLQANRWKPDDARILFMLGSVYGTLGDYGKSIDYSRQAILWDPNLADAYRNLAIALARTGRAEEAFTWVERGLNVAPSNTDLLNIRSALTNP